MSLNISFEGVKESGFAPLPVGTYFVIADDAEVKDSKSGGSYINVKFRVLDGEHKDKFLFSMFNFKNDNAKAVEIGLSQLKTFMKCAGSETTTLTDVLNLVGLRCDAVVKHRTDDYGTKATISYFKPHADQPGAPAKASTPF